MTWFHSSWLCDSPLCLQATFALSMHPLMTFLGWVHTSAFLDRAQGISLVNKIHFLWPYSLEYVAESHASSIFMFCVFFFFLKNLHTVLHNEFANLYSHQQCMDLCSSSFFASIGNYLVILTGLRWTPTRVFICIHQLLIYVEYFHIFVDHCISFFEECLFRSLAHFYWISFNFFKFLICSGY